MTDRNCDTCGNYVPSDRYYDSKGVQKIEAKPDIRAFTQAEFDLARKDKSVWERVYHKCLHWKHWYEFDAPWSGTDCFSNYGLPITDPFWFEPKRDSKGRFIRSIPMATIEQVDPLSEFKNAVDNDPFIGKKVWWDGMLYNGGHKSHGLYSKRKAQFVECMKRYENGNYRINGYDGSLTGVVEPFQLSLIATPLVKVWAIDKTGKDLPGTPYEFRGQPDWKRIKEENKDAEAIAIKMPEEGMLVDMGFASCDWLLLARKTYYYNDYMWSAESRNKLECFTGWFGRGIFNHNPVPAIRAAIIERNKPKFKVGDWVVKTTCDNPAPYQITYGMPLPCDNKQNILLRLATRSDFIVKINGHEWLAVEDNTQPHDWLWLYCDGEETLVKIGHLPKGAIKELLNLPVCPAGLK